MHVKFARYAVMNLVVMVVVHTIGVAQFAKYAIEGIA